MLTFRSDRVAASVASPLGGLGRVLTLLAMLGTGLLPAPGVHAQATPAPAGYVIHELPTLGGDNGSVVEVNDAGVAVGWSELRPGEDEAHATLWVGGEAIDLGTLGGNGSLAIDINDAGIIVGNAENADGNARAVTWRDGTIGDLGTLGGDNSVAHAINAQGAVVGRADTTAGERHAVVWHNGVMTDLGTLGGPNSDALHITEEGVVYGTSETASGLPHAARWENGGVTSLGALGGASAFAMAANASGVVIGHAAPPDGADWALVWRDGAGLPERLDPDDPTASVAVAINDAGNISGSIAPSTPQMRAVIWRDGERLQLPGFVDDMSGSFSITNAGVVGGYAADASGHHRPVLWVPASAPTPAALAGAPVSLAEGGDDAAVSTQFTIESYDIFFGPTEIEAPANTDVTILLPNLGAALHNFSIDALGVDVDIAPGATEEVVFNAPAGEYEYYCSVPGHREAGMVGTLVVSDDTGAAAAAPVTPVATAQATPEAVAEPAAAATESVEVVSYDIYFEPAELTIPANTDVTFVLPNNGVAPHNFSIDALGISVDIARGETKEVVLNASAGEYEFYCNVPGHTEAGMVGTLIVREDVATAPALAATPTAPAASPTPAPLPFVWDQVDVTVSLRQDGSFRVTERDRVAFSGGPFRSGYREIPLARIERVDDIRVGEVNGSSITPYRFVAPEAFSPAVPHTYTWRDDGSNLRIDWSFPETASAARTFQIGFDAFGALRVYADADSPYQQISWIGVDEVLTATAPVNEASLTFVLPRAIEPSRTIIQGPGSNRSADHTADGQTWVWRASDLGAGESLTASLRFPPLVSAAAPAWQEASDRAPATGTEVPPVITPLPSGTPAPQATPVAGPMDAPPCRNVMENDFPDKRRELLADCTTDRPIFVPEAWIFDGGGHTIYTRDPDGGQLSGGVVTVSGDGSTVRNVTVDGSGLTAPCLVDDGATALAGVLVRGNDADVAGVTVRNLSRTAPVAAGDPGSISALHSCGAGIAVEGSAAQGFVTENTIENVGLAGILIDGGTASISHNAIDRVSGAGILAANGANVRVSPGNRVTNSRDGIHFEDRGTGGRIAGNTIVTSTRAGIAVILGARATIADNTVEDAFYGIEASGSATVDVRGNTIRRAQDSAVLVSHSGTQAAIAANTIDASTLDGIWVQQGAQASITGNTVAGTTRFGIVAMGGANVDVSGENRVTDAEVGVRIVGSGTVATVTGNTIARTAGPGITVREGATAGDVSGNAVSEAEFGVTVLGVGTSASVVDNAVASIEKTGITVESGARAGVRHNRISDAGWGIVATGAGTTADLAENRIERTTSAGIILEEGSQTTATANTIASPGIDGIRIADPGTTATITQTLVSGATETGIEVIKGASAEIAAGNRIVGGQWGITVVDAGTSATVSGNTVSGFTNQGLAAVFGAQATFTGNQISEGETGILVKDRGSAIVEGNTIRGQTNTGIRFEQAAAGAGDEAADTARRVELEAGDIYFEPTDIAIPAGTDVTVVVTNSGVTVHRFVIEELGIREELAPGETREVVINAPAGTYEFRCDVPGHTEAGQVGTLTVSAGAELSPPEAPGQNAIRDNDIAGGRFGIVVTGPWPALGVADNTIATAASAGITLENGAAATVAGNAVTDANTGINVAHAGTSVTLDANRVTGSTERGIHVQVGAEATLRGNTVARAGTSGIVIGGQETSATLTGNSVSNAAENGIVVEGAASATIADGNSVSGGKWGISILSDGTTADVRGNRIRDASNQGISVLYGASATVADNTVHGGDSGIYVRYPQSRAVITGNTVSAEQQGIYIWDEATAERITDNVVTQSFSGIVVEGQSVQAVIEDNNVSNFAREGIAVLNGATADVTGNRVQENRSAPNASGIIVAGPDAAATIAGNEVAHIGDFGIHISQGATGTVHDNTVSDVSDIGIRVIDAVTEVVVSGNTLRDVGRIGIEARDSDVAIRDNTITGSSYAGIQLGVDADVETTGNTIVGPAEPDPDDSGPFGVHIQRDVSGVVSGNRISGVDNTGAACAISIDANAPDIIVADNQFPLPANDQDICDERLAEPGATPASAATPIAATPLPDDLLVPSATGREGL